MISEYIRSVDDINSRLTDFMTSPDHTQADILCVVSSAFRVGLFSVTGGIM